jgi:hypothetical protein
MLHPIAPRSRILVNMVVSPLRVRLRQQPPSMPAGSA